MENIRIIQFHQSYSYEDFIEGIKLKLSLEGEATGFIKQSGILKNLVDRCIKNLDKKFVLIIDEINRDNISNFWKVQTQSARVLELFSYIRVFSKRNESVSKSHHKRTVICL